MSRGDFVCTSANDGTHLFRPVSARGHTFWQEQNYNKFVNFRWWKRRNQAFNFILLLDRKNYNKYKSLDFFITKLVYRIFSIF